MDIVVASKKKTSRLKNNKKLNKYAVTLIVFAAICFFMGIFAGKSIFTIDSDTFTNDEITIVGPIETTTTNSLFKIKASQKIYNYGNWCYLSGEVLDKNKEYLFGFGKELYRETGRDSDGTWYENKTSYSTVINLKKPGTYYIKLYNESESNPRQVGNITYSISAQKASNVPYVMLSIFSIIAGVILLIMANRAVIAENID